MALYRLNLLGEFIFQSIEIGSSFNRRWQPLDQDRWPSFHLQPHAVPLTLTAASAWLAAPR